VTVSSPIVKQLEDRGWIEAIGYREAPGRPALYATTRQFLDDLGLASLDQLPPINGALAADALSALEQTAPIFGEAQAALPLDAPDNPDDLTSPDTVSIPTAPEDAAEIPLPTDPQA